MGYWLLGYLNPRERSSRRREASRGFKSLITNSVSQLPVGFALAKPPLCELLKSFVLFCSGAGKNSLDVRAQAWLAPIVAGGFLGRARVAVSCSLEDRTRRSS